ncbi:FAD-dependent oxidoreductase [Stappia sp.]|uniref:NAD(P)/FAD-dependent oxidoreductase n=1 Tax=Stappia sp. TaxID=1870903 RepID=UPI0032D8F15F
MPAASHAADAGTLIVGAGQAGLTVAETLRKGGYAAPVTLIGAEADAPYQRPPLSKGYLLGDVGRDRLALKPPEWFARHDVTLRTGLRVAEIELESRHVRLADGERLAWRHLVIATGARPRPLPEAIGGRLAGVHTIRARTDIDRLRADLVPGARLLVIGGGYIGLEAAAAARTRGLEVVLIESAPRLLARVTGAETADWLAETHRRNGVDLRLGCQLVRLHGADRVTAAEFGDGSRIAVDCVVVGIGALPETALAEQADLACANGIRVDARGRTSREGVWAAGDCATFDLPDGPLRLESVGNAVDTGALVARNILGADDAYAPEPWFWSDQYATKLQIAGLSAPGDAVVVRDVAGEGRSHWYIRSGRLVAVDALGAPRAYMSARKLLKAGLTPPTDRIGDPKTPLGDLLATCR